MMDLIFLEVLLQGAHGGTVLRRVSLPPASGAAAQLGNPRRQLFHLGDHRRMRHGSSAGRWLIMGRMEGPICCSGGGVAHALFSVNGGAWATAAMTLTPPSVSKVWVLSSLELDLDNTNESMHGRMDPSLFCFVLI